MPILKKLKEVIASINPATKQPWKPGEEGFQDDDRYLILLNFDDDMKYGSDITKDSGEYKCVYGKKEMVDYLAENFGGFGLLDSYILMENMKLGEEICTYSVLKFIIESNDYSNSDALLSIEEINSELLRQYPEMNSEKIDSIYKIDSSILKKF